MKAEPINQTEPPVKCSIGYIKDNGRCQEMAEFTGLIHCYDSCGTTTFVHADLCKLHSSLMWPAGEDFTRASGDCICDACGEDYYSHSPAEERHNLSYDGNPFLHRLCDGSLVKL